jgi:microcompartment protein CcmK/EutM
MRIAIVVGTVIATAKDEKLKGRKLLLLRESDSQGRPLVAPKGEEGLFVAVDAVNAGKGELVMVTSGSSARKTLVSEDLPVDSIVVAIIDSLEVEGKTTWRKGE